ncbi:MAG: type II CAAX prenyl endopeptidase Rce1 family protein [Exilispira sp.]
MKKEIILILISIILLFINIFIILILKKIQKSLFNKEYGKYKYIFICISEFLLNLIIIYIEGSRFLLVIKLLQNYQKIKIIAYIINLFIFVFITYFYINRYDKNFLNFVFKYVSKKSLLNSILYFIPFLIFTFFIAKIRNNKLFTLSGLLKLVNFNSIIVFLFTFSEEYLFRYILEYRRIYYKLYIVENELKKNNLDVFVDFKIWIIFSIIFSFVHAQYIIFLSLNELFLFTTILVPFIISIYLYFYRLKTNAIYFSTLVHFIFNLAININYLK